MKKALFLFLFLFFLPYFLQAAGAKGNAKTVNDVHNSSELNVDLNQNFLLEVNQKALVKGEGLGISAIEVIDDLCKDGLKCDEGSMSIRLVVSKGNEKKEILLTTKDSRKPSNPVISEVLGYKIQLLEMGESAAMLVVRKLPSN